VATLYKRLATVDLSHAKFYFSWRHKITACRHLGVTYCHRKTGVTCQEGVLKWRRRSATSSRLIVRLARLACCRTDGLYGPPTLYKPSKGWSNECNNFQYDIATHFFFRTKNTGDVDQTKIKPKHFRLSNKFGTVSFLNI